MLCSNKLSKQICFYFGRNFLHLPKFGIDIISSLFLQLSWEVFFVALDLLHHMVLLCSLSLPCLLKCTGKKFPVRPLSLIELSFARKSVVSFHAPYQLPTALPIDCSHSLARSPSSLHGGDQTSTTGILQDRSSSRVGMENTVYIR